MIRDGIRPFSLPSRSSVAERRPYKPVVAGSIPAGRTGSACPRRAAQTPNQALQQTGAACALSGIRRSPSGPGC
jgi:hypothetical protein